MIFEFYVELRHCDNDNNNMNQESLNLQQEILHPISLITPLCNAYFKAT